ncbi:uncharacterized protein LOC128385964 [Panonychus citri]|uniref:uncharacterized protein LOC128385964 n=1 Tax=Panonychus citri TaxID=50023 RepID=UPI0023076B9F|nr:uncharacterized protein LOC128385964 [Panonychus citri]
MRFSIVLAICFLGVASASSLVKRNYFDDLMKMSMEDIQKIDYFSDDFNKKVQEAYKQELGMAYPSRGVRSAESKLVKRSFFDDLMKMSPEEIQKIDYYSDDFNKKVQEAYKQELGMAYPSRGVRAANPLQLLNELDDPAAFAQTLLKVLGDMARQGGR